MSKFPFVLSAAIEAAPKGQLVARARNWHDRMMSYNKGQGFDMVLITLPDDPYLYTWHTYKEGVWAPAEEENERPEDVPEYFAHFTGVVEGISSYLDGEFIALTFYTSEGQTPTDTYTDAARILSDSGFITAKFHTIPGNGWNALEANISKVFVDNVSAVIAIPDRPRLAESAFRKGVQVSAHIAPGSAVKGDLREIILANAIKDIPRDAVLEDLITDDAYFAPVLKFLISGRFDVTKEDIARTIEAEGHEVVTSFSDDVDVVVVSSSNSRTSSSNKARAAGKILIELDKLEDYLINH